MSSNIFSLIDTWNAVGTTFTAIGMNVSNGAGGVPVYAAGSQVLRFQKNGTDAYSVDVNGQSSHNVAIGGLWQRPEPISLNAVNYRAIVNQNPLPGGGVGGEDYVNEVVAQGWNLSDTVGVAGVVGKASVWDGWESKYNIGGAGGKYYCERHMESLDTAGVLHRFLSFAVPHDGGLGSSHRIAIDSIIWTTYDALSTPIQWNVKNNTAGFGSNTVGFDFTFNKNNVPLLRQHNAANSSYLALPYYDADNKLVSSGQELHNINGSVAASANASAATYNFNSVTFGATSYYLGLQGPNVAGTALGAILMQGGTSSSFFTMLQNVTTAGRAQYVAQCTGAGRSSFSATNGTTAWVSGLDSSGNYFIGSDEFHSADVLTANYTNRNVTFTVPPKMPSYTVAALPSAVTFVAGSRAFVTDATTPAWGVQVVGGGAVKVPVYSDGANWIVG